ncbi:hypothetical protein JCM5296_000330 [Sporobolomyces johnsonii]
MSSSAADARGHVRADSIAQKRTNSTPSKASPTKRAQLGAGAGAAAGGASSGRALTGSQAGGSGSVASTIPPKLAVRLIVGALALFLVLHFGSPLLGGDSSLAHRTKERKALMEGSGESWILAKRWREYGAGDGPVSLGHETLPECKRVMLFKFSNTHGFSSELLHYLRALVVANKLGYTLLADDSEWNMGSLSEYFLPRLVYCRPPSDWFDTSKATKVGTRRWQSKDRVWVSREMEDETDEWIREEMLDPNAIAELRSRQLGHILPEGETLPPALEEVFADFSAAVKEVWRPNHQLAVLIRKQRMELGLGGGGLRHRKHSPTWGGNRRQGDDGSSPTAEELAEEEEFEQEYEFGVAERSDRGPVVGVHLSGLKPRLDLAQFGLTASSRAGNLSAAFEGASDAVRRLSHASIAAPSYSRSRPTIFPPTATPTLVALTGNASLFSDFAADQAALPFNVLRTSSPPYEDLRRWNDVLRLELTEDIAPPKGDAGTLLKEFNQDVWNKDLPRALQIYLTRYFVRDLTTLSQFADAFVVSGASPTGRLALLLAGEEGTIGPRDFHGGSFGGRVRSVDGFWTPTSRIEALYE